MSDCESKHTTFWLLQTWSLKVKLKFFLTDTIDSFLSLSINLSLWLLSASPGFWCSIFFPYLDLADIKSYIVLVSILKVVYALCLVLFSQVWLVITFYLSFCRIFGSHNTWSVTDFVCLILQKRVLLILYRLAELTYPHIPFQDLLVEKKKHLYLTEFFIVFSLCIVFFSQFKKAKD